MPRWRVFPRVFPTGWTYEVALDTTKFVKASIDEVVHTFFEALVLVVLVVFVFLRSIRLTIIPTLAVPVSIFGAMIGMLAVRLLDQHAHPVRHDPRHRYRGG